MNDTGEMTQIRTPEPVEAEVFNDATKAVDRLQELYDAATTFLCAEFEKTLGGQDVSGRIRAYYPEVRLRTTSFAQTDNRLSFGHVTEPGTYRRGPRSDRGRSLLQSAASEDRSR